MLKIALKNALKSRFICRNLSSLQGDQPKISLKSFDEIPGPKPYPIIGIVCNFLPGGKYFNKNVVFIHSQLRKDYGDIVLLRGMFGAPNIVFCYDPDDISLIYRTEGQWPIRKIFDTLTHYRQTFRQDIFAESTGLLTEQGEKWYNFRSKVNPVMLQPRTVRTYIKPVDEVALEFIERIKSIRDDKKEVPADFGNEMNKWALESIGRIALDVRLGVLGDLKTNSDAQLFIQSVHDFFDLLYELEVLPSFWKYYETRKFKKMMQTLDTLTSLTMKYVDEAIERLQSTNNERDPNQEQSVLEKLLKINRNTAVVMALDMLMAGVDTTSAATIICLNFLAKNPEKQEKLRREIFENLPKKDSPLDADVMKNMPYLRACMKESARIIPIVSGNLRETDRDLSIKGYNLPKGSTISLSHMVIQNDDHHFKRSTEFIPERWLKTDDNFELSYKDVNKFVYMPFGFGPRTCIGRRFAHLEMEVILMRILRNFRVEWHYPEMQYVGKMLNTPGGDLKFRFVDLD